VCKRSLLFPSDGAGIGQVLEAMWPQCGDHGSIWVTSEFKSPRPLELLRHSPSKLEPLRSINSRPRAPTAGSPASTKLPCLPTTLLNHLVAMGVMGLSAQQRVLCPFCTVQGRWCSPATSVPPSSSKSSSDMVPPPPYQQGL
jgi:hypothetical protein